MNDSFSSWSSPLDSPGSSASSTQLFSGMIGTPDLDVREWDGQQSYNADCAIRAQQFILEQFTGVKVNETALLVEAEAHGWFDPRTGTSPEDVGKELELHGIPVHRYEQASISTLANELAQGHKVIVGVDSGTLWSGVPDGAEDHAVVVSGIDTSNPGHWQVIVSDPGTGEAEHRYPLEQFVQAWSSGNFFMVATQQAPPPTTPGMEYFDYTAGHISDVAGVPYDQFLTLQNHPDAVHALFDGATAGEQPLSPQDIFHDANPDVYPAPLFHDDPWHLDDHALGQEIGAQLHDAVLQHDLHPDDLPSHDVHWDISDVDVEHPHVDHTDPGV